MRVFPFGLLAVILPFAAAGAVPWRHEVVFEHTQDVGFGNEVFVRGAHPDLSLGGRLPHGTKLVWTSGNIWRATIAIESGAEISTQFVRQPSSISGYCTGNAVALTAPASRSVPAPPPPPFTGKTVRYSSSWSEAVLVWRNWSAGGVWRETPMIPVGAGRTAGEALYEARLDARPWDELEFVFRNAAGAWDNAPAPPTNAATGAAPARPVPYQALSPPYNYRTRLPALHVQDGQVYNYRPPAAPSAPRIERRMVQSSVAGIPGRNISVFLPRGYDSNPWKRYPVVYFHDGQNVFFPGGPFGTWDADRIARYEMGQGRMREAILVAVDNADSYGGTRRSEYVPPGDSVSGLPGRAADYARFLLDNVLPTLDHNYRTANPPGQPPRPGETMLAGSSLGGVVTAYIGREHSSRFGRLGIFSPAFWAMPNYLASVFLPSPKLPLRIYMDIGSAESSLGESSSQVYWNDAFAVANNLIADGYAINTGLVFYPECGGLHNEAAWSRRLPVFFEFALGIWDDPQWLAAEISPPSPAITSVNPSGGTASLAIAGLRGISVAIESSANLRDWSAWAEVPPSAEAWSAESVTGPLPDPGKSFWRAKVRLPTY
ncbi:MAG: alpha/beta hydrolase-fold protein [Terrimicrobiaceae bacterium]|nr:alpha/beta hydrolase-fold protein [Terrimicrobiaceae bacterium]